MFCVVQTLVLVVPVYSHVYAVQVCGLVKQKAKRLMYQVNYS